MFGYVIATNARNAQQIANILSPTRNFVRVKNGLYFMDCVNDVQRDRDVDFIITNRLLDSRRISPVD